MTAPRELRTTLQSTPQEGTSSSRRYLLAFETGGTRVIDLPAHGRLVIGRSPEVDVVVDDESVSRRHAELSIAGSEVTITDLDSRNGTEVARRRIAGTTSVKPGDVVTLGSLTVVVGDATEPQRRAGLLMHTEFEARLRSRLEAARGNQVSVALYLVQASVAPDRILGALHGVLGADALVGVHATHLLEVATGVSKGAKGALLGSSLQHALLRLGVTATVGCAASPSEGATVDELTLAARAALRHRDLPKGPEAFIATSATMGQVVSMAKRVAAGRIPVLILGETGSGKEVIAEAIHRWSPRAGKALVCLNCAALPEALLEAELFGYEKGSFTGATQAKPGLFESAHGGTLLLDEVGDLPPSQQAKLLRVLESGTIRRVGSLQDRKVDVRILAATHRDLEKGSAATPFRTDLFFRLSGATIHVPPLRERLEEILALARHFAGLLAKEAGSGTHVALAPETETYLLRYPWPGNVRELRNAIERATLLCHGGVVLPEHLPDRVRLAVPASAERPFAPTEEIGDTTRVVFTPGEGVPVPAVPAKSDPVRTYDAVRSELKEIERARIIAALESVGGNQTRAAEILGIARRTLVTKIAIYGLSRRGARER
jgi:DNA-binding NtrC family response regulator